MENLIPSIIKPSAESLKGFICNKMVEAGRRVSQLLYEWWDGKSVSKIGRSDKYLLTI